MAGRAHPWGPRGDCSGRDAAETGRKSAQRKLPRLANIRRADFRRISVSNLPNELLLALQEWEGTIRCNLKYICRIERN